MKKRGITPMDDLRERDNKAILNIKRTRKERHEAFMNKLKDVKITDITEITDDLGNAYGNITIINEAGDVIGSALAGTAPTVIGNIAKWGDETATLLVDGGAIPSGGLGDFIGDSVPSVAGNIVVYADTSGKHGEDSGVYVTLDSNDNVVLGTKPAGLTTGEANTSLGRGAGSSIIDGDYNVAVGETSLGANESGNNNTAIGSSALDASTGSNNIGVGYWAGHYETGSDKLFIDTRDRTDEAGDRAGAIIYGVMNDDPSLQELTINGNLTVTGTITPGGGDMLASVYDPTGIAASAFDTDNHIDGATNGVYTLAERLKLSGIEDGAEVNNISDENVTALTDGGVTSLHAHATPVPNTFYLSYDESITIPEVGSSRLLASSFSGVAYHESVNLFSTPGDRLLTQWATSALSLQSFPTGSYSFRGYFKANTSMAEVKLRVYFYQYKSAAPFGLIGSSLYQGALGTSVTAIDFIVNLAAPISTSPSDGILMQLYAEVTDLYTLTQYTGDPDTPAYVTNPSGLGDMLAATYDPNGVEADVFDPNNTPLKTGLADGAYSGETEAGTAGIALLFGYAIYQATDGKWKIMDASTVGTCSGKAGICVLAASGDDEPTIILTRGNVRADAIFPSMTTGVIMYVAGDGALEPTPPSAFAGDIIRPMGYANSAHELRLEPAIYYFEIG